MSVARLRLLALSKLADLGIDAMGRAAQLSRVSAWDPKDGEWAPWPELDAAIAVAIPIDDQLGVLAEGFRVACAKYDRVRWDCFGEMGLNVGVCPDEQQRRFRALDGDHEWKRALAALHESYGAMWQRIEALL